MGASLGSSPGAPVRCGASRVQMVGALAWNHVDAVWAGHPGFACHHSCWATGGVWRLCRRRWCLCHPGGSGLRRGEAQVGVSRRRRGGRPGRHRGLSLDSLSATALLYLIAVWAIVTGVIEIAGAFRTRQVAMADWVLMTSGAISIVFGILLLVWPRLGVLALVWLIGTFAIVYGIVYLVLAFTRGPTRKAAAV